MSTAQKSDTSGAAGPTCAQISDKVTTSCPRCHEWITACAPSGGVSQMRRDREQLRALVAEAKPIMEDIAECDPAVREWLKKLSALG